MWNKLLLASRSWSNITAIEPIWLMIKPPTATYEHIRVTYGWHASTYDWHAMKYVYVFVKYMFHNMYMWNICFMPWNMRLTYKWHASTYYWPTVTYEYILVTTKKWHTSTYQWHANAILMVYKNMMGIRITYELHRNSMEIT